MSSEPGGMQHISIHALREEGDLQGCSLCPMRLYFYPRPPRGGRRWFPLAVPPEVLFLSTPSARRATTFDDVRNFICKISIHALREEGDLHPAASSEVPVDFYPRPPRGGRPVPPEVLKDG